MKTWTFSKKEIIVITTIIVASLSLFLYSTIQMARLKPVASVHVPIVEPEPVNPDPIDTDRIHELVNQYRVEQGLAPLKRIPQLDASAQEKCDDMVKYKYWAHDNPSTGTEPWTFIKPRAYYNRAGENLAYGYSQSKALVNGWKNSPAHNKEMTYEAYDNVGYGLCDNRGYVMINKESIAIVQHFIDAPE